MDDTDTLLVGPDKRRGLAACLDSEYSETQALCGLHRAYAQAWVSAEARAAGRSLALVRSSLISCKV